jgi:hypothetical protein
MTVLWLLLLVVGLLLSVLVMIAGVARSPDATGADPDGMRLRTWLPMVAAFCTVSGMVGYVLTHFRHDAGLRPGLLAAGAAVLAVVVVRAVVRWSSSSTEPDPSTDPRFRFQGHVARVVEMIGPDRPGRIVFQADSRQYQLRATSLDGASVAAGVEVVIERIDDDLATVEPWSRVEERL